MVVLSSPDEPLAYRANPPDGVKVPGRATGVMLDPGVDASAADAGVLTDAGVGAAFAKAGAANADLGVCRVGGRAAPTGSGACHREPTLRISRSRRGVSVSAGDAFAPFP